MLFSNLVSEFESVNLTKDNFMPFSLDFQKHKITDSETMRIVIQYYTTIPKENNYFYFKNLKNIISESNNENLLQNIILYCLCHVETNDFKLKEVFEFQDYVIYRINTFFNNEIEKPMESQFVVEFKQLYPEFQNVSGDKIDILHTKLSCIFTFLKKNGCKYKQMSFLIVAHYLSIENINGLIGMGTSIINSASVGGVSVSLSQITPTSYWQQFFASTKYGLEFLAIRGLIGSATLIN